jgi:hypothetical protein
MLAFVCFKKVGLVYAVGVEAGAGATSKFLLDAGAE